MDFGLDDLPALTEAQLVQAHDAALRNGLPKLAGLLAGYINRGSPPSLGESVTIRQAIQLCGGRQPVTEE